MRSLLTAVVMVFAIIGVNAAIRLPALVGNNMVLQQNADIRLWGWADAGENIIVKAGWLAGETSTTTNAGMQWQVVLHTPAAGGPYEISIDGRDYSVKLVNVMIGEVWICSGQSNMDFTISGLGGLKYYPADLQKHLASRDNSAVRVFTVQHDTSSVEKTDCHGYWVVSDTATASSCSATAWFFGTYLHDQLNVPVGLIVAAWGGTTAEAWTPLASLKSEPDLGYYLTNPNRVNTHPTAPGVLYNAMINPLTPFVVRGAIWYQGESNRMDAKYYTGLMKLLITSWHEKWNSGDFPFYFVQIAPFNYNEPYTAALLREAQLKCLELKNTGMVVTNDITDNINDIHPKNKHDVGKRLALWALAKTYGKPDVVQSGPLFRSIQIRGNKAMIDFDFADGLSLKNNSGQVEIAGRNTIFYPAEVKIQKNKLVAYSPKVKNPVAVRYAFSNMATASLFNGSGLPASPFRTDNWAVITHLPQLRVMQPGDQAGIVYELFSLERESDIWYGFGKPGVSVDKKYVHPVELNFDGILKAVVGRDEVRSGQAIQWILTANKAKGCKVSYDLPYSEKYASSGSFALVDGIIASNRFDDGCWQGVEKNDFSVTLDLGKPIKMQSISFNFLSDNPHWIYLPLNVEILVSTDGNQYTSLGSRKHDNSIENQAVDIQHVDFQAKGTYRFVKLLAQNQKICPSGHRGAGGDAWLFIDEIVVK